LGPKSKENANEARKLEPSNWFAYLQLANIENYTPKILGGSKVNALKYYLISLKLLESNPRECQYNWNYLNLYVTIAQVYIDMNNFKKAESYYKKVLQIEPNFKWVKYNLYPQLKQLISESN
jgi:tetratricopeptide (TPR) repeat protein